MLARSAFARLAFLAIASSLGLACAPTLSPAVIAPFSAPAPTPASSAPSSPGAGGNNGSYAPSKYEYEDDSAVVLFTAPTGGDLCQSLEPRNARLDDGSPSGAVRAIVRSKAFEHLSLSDPELRVEENTARVELSGKSPGSSVSAWSRCEELSLLGAIRMTLQVNAKWGIRQVVFTSKGNLLAV
jgi:hypothetical protein